MDLFDDGALENPAMLATVDGPLRRLAQTGADVRQAAVGLGEGLRPDALPARPRAVLAAGPDGRLLRAVLETTCPVPFVAWPFAHLPGWAGPLDLVVVPATIGRARADSELVPVLTEALRRGCLVVLATPATSALREASAAAPTSSVIHLPVSTEEPLALAVPVLALLHRWGLGPRVEPEEVARALDEVAVACGPAAETAGNQAKELAIGLAEAVPVVWGGSVLAARAARRVAESLRTASGRPAVAGETGQVLPLLRAAPPRDPFADPFSDPLDEVEQAAQRPALVVMDDGRDDPAVTETLVEEARRHDVRVLRVQAVADDLGSDLARYAALVMTGRYASVYLALALGHADER